MPRKITKLLSSAKQKIGIRKSTGSSRTTSAAAAALEAFSPEVAAANAAMASDSQKLLDPVEVGDNDGQIFDDFTSPDLNLESLGQPGPEVTPNVEGANGMSAGLKRWLGLGGGLTQDSGYNELFAEQKDLHQKNWWKSNFILGHGKPTLFGTWDGVYVTCVVHLFGVLSFLRIGWMVGNEGIFASMVIVFACFLFNTISLLAAIGIMERCAAVSTGSFPGLAISRDPEYPSTVASARANVHLLISTVLGSRLGGAISLVYCFGQAVSCALHVTGFTETFVQLCALFIERHLKPSHSQSQNQTSSVVEMTSSSLSTTSSTFARTMARVLLIEIGSLDKTSDATGSGSTDQFEVILTPYTYQLVSALVILVLFLFNILGVKCLFRLQTFLFASLLFAILDFTVGLFEHHLDFGYGPIYGSTSHLAENLYPSPESDPRLWGFWSQLFATVGVFFPATIGVMAGVNMGSDLETPARAIPVGSLSAILSSYLLHLLFILGLGVTCTRVALLQDYSIAQHVSAIGLFFMLGLYMSTLSSGLGSMYTAPRIMQNLAQELHQLPVVKCFAVGRGPNKIPINALILFTLVTLTFVMIGGINVLAPIVTIPYLLTYATIEYAYFSMAMTFDIQISREKRFMAIASQLGTVTPEKPPDKNGQVAVSEKPVIVERFTKVTMEIASEPTTPTGGKSQLSRVDEGDTLSLTPSLGPIPPSPTPSLQQHLAGYGSVQSITQHIKIVRRQSTQSESGSGSDGETEAGQGGKKKKGRKSTAPPKSPKPEVQPPTQPKQQPAKPKKTIKQLMAAVSDTDDEEEDAEASQMILPSARRESNSIFRFETSALMKDVQDPTQAETDTERLLNPDPELAEIGCKQEVWYLRIMNRWIVLVAAILKLGLMFVVAWHYALLTLGAFLALYFIIGRTNPGFYPGVSEFVLWQWLKNCGTKCGFRKHFGMSAGSQAEGANLVASYSYDRIVLPPSSLPSFTTHQDQLTSENTDFSSRPPCHFTTTINSQLN